jgi:lipoate-protein ligase A
MWNRFEIIQDGPRDARCHMEIDHALAVSGHPHPCLRIYDWAEPAITTGLFSEPERLLDLERCRACRMEVVKRPTGGGILFHHKDLVCSVFIPNESSIEPVYKAVNERLRAALAPFLPALDPIPSIPDTAASRFCMAQAAATDLLWQGRKIGGCAQRKTRSGILLQGSIFLTRPDWERMASCVRHADDITAMRTTSTSLEELSSRPVDRQSVREAIASQFYHIRFP